MTTQPAILIFDGDCGFCTSTSNFIERNSSSPIAAHPWQFIDVTQYGLTQAQTAAKVYLVRDGHGYAGHEAFAQILILQRNVFLRTLGYMLMVPPLSWLARPGYSLVARFRHKLPGGTPACKMDLK